MLNPKITNLKIHFKHLKFYSNPQADWSDVVVIWAPFERHKVEVHAFVMANPSACSTWNLSTKEELNPQKQVFLLNLRHWFSQKPKMWSMFHGNMFI